MSRRQFDPSITASEMSRDMEMTFWVPETEAMLAELE
jgi:hypothetical protein